MPLWSLKWSIFVIPHKWFKFVVDSPHTLAVRFQFATLLSLESEFVLLGKAIIAILFSPCRHLYLSISQPHSNRTTRGVFLDRQKQHGAPAEPVFSKGRKRLFLQREMKTGIFNECRTLIKGYLFYKLHALAILQCNAFRTTHIHPNLYICTSSTTLLAWAARRAPYLFDTGGSCQMRFDAQ